MKSDITEIILENCGLGAIKIDSQARIELWNRWMELRTGKSGESVLGCPLKEVFTDADNSFFDTVQYVLSTGLPRVLSPVFHFFLNPYDSQSKQLVKILPLFDQSADITGTLILIEDMTAHLEYESEIETKAREFKEFGKKAKKDEEEALDWLKQQIQFNNAITECLEEGIIIYNRAGIVTFVNPTADKLLQWSRMELVGSNINVFLSGESRVKDVLKTGESIHSDNELFRRKDGSSFPVSYISSPIILEGKIKWGIVTFQDITERKRIEKEINENLERLKKVLDDTVKALSFAGEMRDPYTAGHQRRVTQLALEIAKEMSLGDNIKEAIRISGILHDIGKITIPAEILSKPGRLTEYERIILKGHSQVGYEMIKAIDFPLPVADIIIQHHERLDGSGYPNGLKGDEIRLEARILAVSDVVEAMSSHRPYRPALGAEKALEEIERNAGTLYDEEVVKTCVRLFREKGFTLE